MVLVAVSVGCAEGATDSGARAFDPVDPVTGSEGEPGPSGQEGLEASGGTAGVSGAAGEGSEDGGAAGASSPEESGGAAGGSGDPAGGAAGQTPVPSQCGATGDVCCATGAACTGNAGKAKCCDNCTGFPDFKCNCGSSYRPTGECKVCCVVCADGTTKPPQYVGPNQTCDGIAAELCASKGGANADKSGWKASCS